MGNKCLKKKRQDNYSLPTQNLDTLPSSKLNQQLEQQYKTQIAALEGELKQVKDELKQKENTIITNQQENKSNINKWYATFSSELFQNSFLKVLSNNIKMNINFLVQIESIADMLKQANLTIDMFDVVDPLNEIIDQIPPQYLSLKLNKKYQNYNNKRVIPSNIQQWTTLYHGTSMQVSRQIIENNLKPGPNNGCGGQICRLTSTSIAYGQVNIYFSNTLAGAEQYGRNKSQYQGKQFIIIFQCKVNPQGYKSPTGSPTVFTVQDNMNVIPEFMLIAPQ